MVEMLEPSAATELGLALTVDMVALTAGVNEKFFPLSVSPLLRLKLSVAELKPVAEAVNVILTGPFPLKLSLVVVLSKTYAPVLPEVVEAAGLLLQPAVQVIVAPAIAGLPAALLLTVPLADVALPSVNVVCA